MIAAEIVEDLEAALQQFAPIANDLKRDSPPKLIRIFPAAHPSGLPSMFAAPAISIVLFQAGAGECLREAHPKTKGDKLA